MKNRKIILVAFMLVAVMLIGVGYAALTDIFVISGSAEVGIAEANKVFDDKIYFASATPKESTGTSGIADTASVSSTDNDNASFSVNSLALMNEAATYTFIIKNDSEFDATIAVKTPASENTGHFTTIIEIANNGLVKAGETIEVTVTTTLVHNVTTAVSASTTIELTATTTE